MPGFELDINIEAFEKGLKEADTQLSKFQEKVETPMALGKLDVDAFKGVIDSLKGIGDIKIDSPNFSSNITQMESFIGKLTEMIGKLQEFNREQADAPQTGAGSGNIGNISLENLDAIKQSISEIKAETYTTIESVGDLSNEFQNLSSQEKIDLIDKNATKNINEILVSISELSTAQKELKKSSAFDDAMDAFKNLDKENSSIRQRTEVIKQLKEAREDLTNADGQYDSKLKELNQSIRQLDQDNKRAINSTENLAKSKRNLLDISGQLTRKLALVFSVSQVLGYIKKLREVRGEFELQQKSLQAIIQNKEAADEVFNKTVALAIKSPFKIKELITYTKQLAAYRIETGKLYDTTKMLADVSAGLGVEVGRLILAFGQVKAANYLRGQELRQFSEAGVNILGELADLFTELEGRAISTGEVFERVSKRMVTFEHVEEVFKRLTKEGGIFYNMQEIQAETLWGMWNKLGDQIDVMLNQIGKSQEGILKGFISMLETIVENWQVIADILKGIAVGLPLLIGYFTILNVKQATNVALMSAYSKGDVTAPFFRGLIASLVRTTGAIKGINVAMSKSIIGIVVAGVIAGTLAWRNHSRKVQEAKKHYSDINNQMLTTAKTANNYTNELIAINEKLAESKKTAKDTAEIIKLENEAQKERISFINKIKQVSPAYAKALQDAGDSATAAAEAQKLFNIQLELTNYLLYLAEQQQTFFSKGIVKAAEKYEESAATFETATTHLETQFAGTESYLRTQIAHNDKLSDDLKKQILNILDSEATISEKIVALASIAPAQPPVAGAAILRSVERELSEYVKVIDNALKGVSSAYIDFNSAQYNLNRDLSETTAKTNEILDGLIPSLETKMGKKIELFDANELQFGLDTLTAALEKLGFTGQRAIKIIQDIFVTRYKEAFSDSISEILSEFGIFGKQLTDLLAKFFAEGLSEDFLKNLKEIITDTATFDELVAKLNKYNIKVNAAITSLDPELEAIKKTINDFIKKNKLSIIPEIQEGEQISEYLKTVQAQIDGSNEKVGQLNGQILLLQTLLTSTSDPKLIEEYNKQIEAAKLNIEKENDAIEQRNIFLEYFKYLQKTTQTSGKDTALERLKNQISAVKDLNKAYKDYRKTLGETKTLEILKGQFKDRFIDLGLEDEYNNFIKYIQKGELAEALELLGRKGGKQISDELQKEINKATSKIQADIVVSVAVEQVESAEKQIADMFSGYEMTIRLQELGFDQDLAKQFAKQFDLEILDARDFRQEMSKISQEKFGLDIFGLSDADIEDIKKQLEEISAKAPEYLTEQERQYKELSEKQLELRKKGLQQLNDFEIKYREKQFKDYSDFLKSSMSERIKIEIETQDSITKINNNAMLSREEKVREIARLEADQRKKAGEIKFKEFKESDMYIRMFEDIEYTSTTALKKIKEKLEEFKDSYKELSPTDLKTIMDEINKIDKTLSSRNPFKSLTKGIKDFISNAKLIKDLDFKILESESQEDKYKAEVNRLEDMLQLLQERYKKEVVINGLNSEVAEQLQGQIDHYVKLLSSTENDLRLQKDKTKELGKQKKELTEQQIAVIDNLGQVGQTAKTLASDITDIASNLENVFGIMSDGMRDTLESISGIIDGIGEAADGASELALGIATGNPFAIISGGISLIKGLTKSIGEIFAIGDKKKERAIQKQIEQIEQLEKAYNKLNREIEKGLSIDAFAKSSEQFTNLNKQIEGYQKMIAKEQGKKKTDKKRIKEWNNEIDNLMEQVADLYDSLQESLVGNFKSIAQELSDAFVGIFIDAENAAKDWEQMVNDIVASIIKNMIVMKYIEPKIMEELDKFYAKTMPKTAAAEEAAKEYEEAKEYYDYAQKAGSKQERKEAEERLQKAREKWMKANEKAWGEMPKFSEKAFNDLEYGINTVLENVDLLPEYLKKWLTPLEDMTELTGLQKGIQGITEETATALEALLNSIRFITFNSNAQLVRINQFLYDTEGLINPMLWELKAQTQLIRTIDNRLSSIIKPENVAGGMGVRVWAT